MSQQQPGDATPTSAQVAGSMTPGGTAVCACIPLSSCHSRHHSMARMQASCRDCRTDATTHQEDDGGAAGLGDVKHTTDGLLAVTSPLGQDHGGAEGQQREACLSSNLLHQQSLARAWRPVQQERLGRPAYACVPIQRYRGLNSLFNAAAA